jgi:hypothetical protein
MKRIDNFKVKPANHTSEISIVQRAEFSKKHSGESLKWFRCWLSTFSIFGSFSDLFFRSKNCQKRLKCSSLFSANNDKFNAVITEPNMKTLEIYSNSEKISEINVQYIKNSGSIQSPSNQPQAMEWQDSKDHVVKVEDPQFIMEPVKEFVKCLSMMVWTFVSVIF